MVQRVQSFHVLQQLRKLQLFKNSPFLMAYSVLLHVVEYAACENLHLFPCFLNTSIFRTIFNCELFAYVHFFLFLSIFCFFSNHSFHIAIYYLQYLICICSVCCQAFLLLHISCCQQACISYTYILHCYLSTNIN